MDKTSKAIEDFLAARERLPAAGAPTSMMPLDTQWIIALFVAFAVLVVWALARELKKRNARGGDPPA